MMGLFTIVISCVTLAGQAEEKSQAILQGYDAIARPGEEVILKAKVERDDFFHRDIADQKVIFRLDGQTIGSAITGEQGIARIAFRPEKEGAHRIQVSIDRDAAFKAEDGEILLQAIPGDRDLMVCDIDETVADVTPLKFLVTPNEEIEPLEGAAEALAELSRSYQVLYLTARDDAFMRKTKTWMEMHHLPRAPVFFWDFLGTPSRSRAGQRKEQIASFKKAWPNVKIGIGGKAWAAEACLANGLRAYVLQDEEEDLPEGSVRVESWAGILADLAREKPADGQPPPRPPEEGGE